MSSGKLHFPDVIQRECRRSVNERNILQELTDQSSWRFRVGSAAGHSDLKTCDEPRRTSRCRITPPPSLKSARSRPEPPRSRGIS
ncbi:hypothetical protein AOLI_G00306510 [Acnodon oligacanthus]